MDDKYCMYETTAVLFDELADVIDDNLRFFGRRTKPIDRQFVSAFERINNVLEPTKIAIEELTKICARFDIDSETKGNGFRSLICLTDKCLFKILEIGIYIQKTRERFFFRSYHNFMQIESYSQVICRLFTMTQVALSLGTILDDGSLFADEDKYPDEVDGLMKDFETIGRDCFYGRSFGFQFSPALQQSLHVIIVALAAYGDGFMRHNGNTARALSSFLHSGKYVVDPELRAKRVVELTQHVSVPFCKSFWSLTENHGIQHVPMLICPNVTVNRLLAISTEPLVMETGDGQKIIDPPFLHTKPKIIQARLLSFSRREGQGRYGSSDSSGSRVHGLSKNLLIHCHGGGFVAQSSKSHEIYLRGWAKDLQCPILSIDYSLSPDAPFPEALNECFYVYNWAIKNCKDLGWSAERVCLVGDSAGGNLIVALTLKLIEEGLRLPDGIVAAYPPLRVQYAPTPSRMLALMDPLLPPGILKVCLRAYAGSIHEDLIKESASGASLITAVFDDFYNPFDLDLGDVAYAARRRKESILAGKRSYSDTNLVTGGHYCVSRPVPGCLKCVGVSNLSHQPKESSSVTENETEDDCLQMHPIQSTGTDTQGIQGTGSTGSNNASSNIVGSIKEAPIPGSHDRTSLKGPKEDKGLQEGSDAVTDVVNPSSGHGHKEQFDPVVIRRSRSFVPSNHRRTRSDSIAESFQRLQPIPGDFEVARQLCNKETEVDGDGRKTEKANCRNTSPVEKITSLGVTTTNRSISKVTSSSTGQKSEFKALFIKETSECVIIDREKVPVEPAIPALGSDGEQVEKVYERQGSSNSISSSVKRMSRDPFMSPLLASDEVLRKFPKLVIVACTLDPLLDDSIDFIRRMKKLQKDSEIFIVDDLPHGFLNLNFASSEAREASDLIAACIKGVLKIGLKHENSFPLSPEAVKEEMAEDARSVDLPATGRV